MRPILLLSLLLPPLPAASAQSVVGRVPPALGRDFHRQRRLELMQRVGKGVILIRGAADTAAYMPFLQEHNFYYLTGVLDPNCELLLIPETGEEILFVRPFNPFQASWEGKSLVPGEETAEKLGIGKVLANKQRNPRLIKELEEALKRCGDVREIYIPFLPEEKATSSQDRLGRHLGARRGDPLDGRGGRNQALREKLGELFPDAPVRNLSRHLNAMRTRKKPEEVRILRYAAELACLGIAEAMKACRPGQRERELAAVAEYAFKRHGAQAIGYMPIVGSGPNGCVLHYWRNDRVMKKGELVVMDFGPEVNGYVADVTRTFPVGGKFTKEARKLVQDVHDAQQAILKLCKPGTTFGQLAQAGSRFLRSRGYKPGIHIKHGPTHHLGMAVHDVSDGSRALEPGMYITVEPGAYLVEKGMGCRIEDCVLITEEGHEVLSRGCPSDPDGVEALMRRKGLSRTPSGSSRKNL